jgi:hypothetical protein
MELSIEFTLEEALSSADVADDVVLSLLVVVVDVDGEDIAGSGVGTDEGFNSLNASILVDDVSDDTDVDGFKEVLLIFSACSYVINCFKKFFLGRLAGHVRRMVLYDLLTGHR